MPRSLAISARSYVDPCSITVSLDVSQTVLPGIQSVPGQRHARHGGGLDGQRDQILRLQIVHVALAAGARDRLRLQRQHREVIGEPPAGRDRVEPRGQFRSPAW